MDIRVENHLDDIASPANLKINDQINSFRQQCESHGCHAPYHHFAFGQSPYSPPPSVIEALACASKEHSYLPTAGIPQLREAVAEFHTKRFGVDCSSDRILTGPGSKEILAISLAVLQGPVIIPVPSWVSYLPQAKILKKEIIGVRTRREDGYKLTAGVLEHAIEHLHAPQKILILNHPNNPTGVVYSKDELEELAEVCRRHQIVVISDEIYALTSFDTENFTSMMRVYPEGTIVTGGLSKDRSCGGYRFGVGIFPKEPGRLFEDAVKIAGSTYSCVSAPIKYAALEGYSGSTEVDGYMRDCSAVNALAGRTMSSLLNGIPGVESTVPEGAFYLYVNFNEQKDLFSRVGLETCTDFCEDLLHTDHTALLPGSALLLPKDDFSVRCSYVDFTGDKALAAWRNRRPEGAAAERAFVEEHFQHIVKGVQSITRYIGMIREGRRPEHV